jgi:hypothetical protein
MNKPTAFTILIAVFLSACSSVPSGNSISTPIGITAEMSTVEAETPGAPPAEGTSPAPVPSTSNPTLSSAFSPTELKYRVLEEFPDFFFCDPDFYPIARGDEMARAQARFPELQANQEEFQAILNRNGLSGTATFTDEQKLIIYRDHKKLNSIQFELAGDEYIFQVKTGQEGQQGSLITAMIDASGSIEVQKQEPGLVTCPICLAAGTLIDTPRGTVRVEDLEVGSPVWTENEAGQRVSASIVKIGSMKVAATHQMIHVTLNDGRELWASAGHPAADGRRLGELTAGDVLDGARIVQIERVLYGESYTFDILPSGATGYYWADGILIGSTLVKP